MKGGFGVTTALYRKTSGEVVKISLANQTWPQVDATYFGVLTDPAFPDGTQVLDPNGDLRILGFAKFADVGGATVRNATQPEIDTFAPGQTTDESAQDVEGGKTLFANHPRWRKLFKAVFREFIDEFNRLRVNPKAQIAIRSGTSTQQMAPNTWAQVTLFNDPQGFNILDHNTLTADKANNRIRALQAGIHLCQYQIAFAGSGNTEYAFDVGINGGLSETARTRRTLGSQGAVGSCSAVGFVNVTTPPVDLAIAARNEESTNRDLTIIEAQLVITRLPNRNTVGLVDLVNAVQNRFDPGD